jgi:hypothetical protein
MEIDEYGLTERFSIMTVDGRQADAAALAYIRENYPQTLKNGLYSALLAKVDKSTNRPAGNANKGVLEHTEQKENAKMQMSEQAVPNYESLRQYIEYGFTLYAQKAGFNDKVKLFPVDWRQAMDKYTKSAGDALATIKTADELQTALKNGVLSFSFLPSEKGFLCFDIDSGHKNGIDGLQVFTSYFAEKNISYDFFNGKAVYTDTPSGGRHLYFNAQWVTDIEHYLTDFLQNVEIRAKGNGRKLTAAGSVKNGTVYFLHGRIADAPELPNMLIKHITPAPKKTQAPTRQKEATAGGYSLQYLVNMAIQDNDGAGRNNTAYHIGFRIGKQYDFESIITECAGRAVFADFDEAELRTAVASGIKNSRY